MMLRNHFLFNPKFSKFATIVLLIGSEICLLVYKAFMVTDDGIIISAQILHKELLVNMIVLFVCLISEVYFDGIRQDVFNELKGYSEKIEQATKDKEVFFACMSHEIRNPLQSLVGSVDLLQHCSDPNQQKTYLKIIKNGCEVVLNLVSNILDISKIEANKMELSLIPTNPGENIGKIVRLMDERARGKGIALEYKELTPLSPCLYLDPHRLHQVILNLVSNAIKFTQRGKVVIVASWIPLEETANVELEIQKELKVSNYKQVINPLQEVENEKEELQKRLRVTKTSFYTPSNRKGRPCHFRSNSELREEQKVPLGTNKMKSAFSGTNASSAFGKAQSSKKQGSLMHREIHDQEEQKVLERIPANANDQDESSLELLHEHTLVNNQGTQQGLVKIEVMDTGMGISKEGIARLFKLYQQADPSISQYFP
eukprot:TRINITY_DN509_c0_g1_i1.p1 TRINITY_DN509_c0_g1~~TRINITY_DN509_c0_g1_i1.p1  ORF type:complete len:428 (-),score=39.51 TRINITY_DN509_c0_g1_i1:2160-3443(-)